MAEKIWKRIIDREPLSLWVVPALFLWFASLVYRLLFWIHKKTIGKPHKVGIPVISVGNITVGGTGKTPLVSLIAKGLQDKGTRVGIVASGYGRTSTKPLMAPGYKIQQMDVMDTGDEVMLTANLLPEAHFSVAGSKTEAAEVLAKSGKADVIIIDDGFQHFRLERNFDLVTYDAAVESHQLKSFPYGLLREPRSGLARADAIVITRAKFADDLSNIRNRLSKIAPLARIFSAGFAAENLIGKLPTMPIKYLEDKSVFLFAGVGNFKALKRQVTSYACDLDFAMELSDHQIYDDSLLQRIKREADSHDSDLILTTFKDWVKVQDFDFGRETYYLDIVMDLDPGEEKFLDHIWKALDLDKAVD